ncbi:hypothetical protein KSP39_PZI005142 [Platanthera zijinensis]|uniref:Nuclear speckle splicing regulatory protein 1 N-terminal domain-containing protein n=1 Tax=Platanthera zijinensis TaxID=2320716 RepID=A0AAP0BRT4_9ASPA
MKKYGLQLRVPPDQQKKMASKPPIRPPPFIFGDDNDYDDVTKEISRQASKSRALQMIDDQQKKALEDDPSAFDYDGVYDKMKMNAARSRVQDQSKREPKYITSIIETAKKREREHEVIYERKLLKERSKDDHEYEDKEKFVTSAYKKQLAERAKWLEEERLQGIREEKEDVTKKSDLTDFYFSLNKNVAFGAQSSHTSEPAHDKSVGILAKTEGSNSNTEAAINFKQAPASVHSEKLTPSSSVPAFLVPRDKAEEAETATASHDQDKLGESSNAVSDDKEIGMDGKKDVQQFKRSDDAITAARERFLARKKAREPLL